MNLLKNSLVSKLMLLTLMFVGAKSLSAETKLYIDPVAITDYEVKEIPVILEQDGTIGHLNFTVELSKSLEFVSPVVKQNADFLGSRQQFNLNYETTGDFVDSQTAKVMIVSRDLKSVFRENKGEVGYIYVKAKTGSLEKDVPSDPELFITIKDVKVQAADRSKTETITVPPFDVSQISEIKLAATNGDFTVKPGETYMLAINMTNDVTVGQLVFNMYIPEGLSFDQDATKFSSRANDAWADYFQNPNDPRHYRVVITSNSNNAFPGKSGDIMFIAVKAADDFAGEAVIKFDGINVSGVVNGSNKDFYANPFEVKVKSGADVEAARKEANKKAYEEDLKAIEAFTTALDAAKAEVEKTYPTYDMTADVEAVKTLIDAAKTAADENYAAVAEAGDYEPVAPAKAEAVKAAIDAIAANAKKAADEAEAARVAANKAAYEKDLADIKPFESQLAMVLAKVADNKDYDVTADKAAAEKAITDAKEAAAANLAAVKDEGEYKSTLDVAKIAAAITAIEKNAAAATAEAARVAANKAAYDAEMALIQQLRDELQAEIDKFKENGWENDLFNERKNVSDYIDGLENKVKSENNRVIPSDTYANQLKDSDMEMARGLIKEYVQKVQTSGIDSIVADEELGNARIYTIDGVQHSRLVPGVNIIVKADGTTTKVYVK